MPSLNLRLTDEQLAELKTLAEQSRLTVTDYILTLTIPNLVNSQTTLLLNDVISKATAIPHGQRFSIKSLYSYEVWSVYSTGNKLSTGRSFYKHVVNNQYNLGSLFKFIEKDSSNTAIYERL